MSRKTWVIITGLDKTFIKTVIRPSSETHCLIIDFFCIINLYFPLGILNTHGTLKKLTSATQVSSDLYQPILEQHHFLPVCPINCEHNKSTRTKIRLIWRCWIDFLCYSYAIQSYVGLNSLLRLPSISSNNPKDHSNSYLVYYFLILYIFTIFHNIG